MTTEPEPGADGDRHARELADRLRTLAAVDPGLAREVVTELVAALDRATDGAFGAHLTPDCRSALGLPVLDGPAPRDLAVCQVNMSDATDKAT